MSEDIGGTVQETCPGPGDVIVYVDEHSRPHDALVTAWWGGDNPMGALNCVYVTADADKRDPYGQQILRASSVSRQSEHTAHGRYWYPKQ